jgi:glycosyltransferase involved in cell wall biosynthesis
MHILHVVQLYRPVPSGAARYFVEIGERLAREGHRVTVLATDAFDLEHLWAAGRRSIAEPHDEHNGVRVVRFPVRRLPGPPIVYPIIRRLMVESGRALPRRFAVPLLYRLAALTPRLPTLEHYLHTSPDLTDIDLVHTTNITLDFALIPVLRWARQRGIPHICTPFVHLGEPGNRQVLRYYSMPHQIDMLRRSAVVITQTELERAFLRRAGVPDQIMRTIGVGVTPAELEGGDGARFRREQQIEPDQPVVLTIGTAAHDKGTPHVVQAMQRLWARGQQAVWVQLGPLMAHFEQFYAALPASDRAHTRLLGFVPDTVRHDALAAASVFVLPSRTDSFGIVYLEAWCYRLPVIGALAGGVPDVIDHGVNGLLVPFGDVDALASAIERLLNERELARAFGVLGQRKVQRELTWEHKYRQVRQVYAEATS